MSSGAARDGELASRAVKALLDELELFPKPGLVSPVDSGSHGDMDYGLLHKSALSLFEPFCGLAAAGASGCPFSRLAEIGIQAERRMLEATGGVNTHRGAIFTLGLLVAGASLAGAGGGPEAVRTRLIDQWGAGLRAHDDAGDRTSSHGAVVRRATGSGGARAEAAAGFPSVFEVALPHLRQLRGQMIPARDAAIETLFVLIARVSDTNVMHRGGEDGSAYARTQAESFLRSGGVRSAGWERRAILIHRGFVSRNLSPGGAADLLAATLFLDAVVAG